ncbi:IclR family transcriptional regulator [Paracoccus chinensis]|uniref:Transcriptional regulator, IclR family n=1 Tax=Paracoccus chinensis TaxID=525640 RepID=A0A1G9FYZ5_9RHOB|nr:IclR family transcriptional regulator [Paracoccus chinensis]SDK93535.1 transcriptional regulator, IclR family [Paracoccus chinensis]
MVVQAPFPATGPALPGGAQAVDRALALLAAVGRAPPEGASLSSLAQVAGVAKPTARRLLISLMGAALVEQDAGTRLYHLGAGAFLLGLRAGRRHDMAELAADCVARLARDSGDSAFLLVPQGDEVVCLMREEGAFPIRTHALLAGDRNPAGVGAGGLALLAALSPEEAAATLDRVAPATAARMGEAAAHLPADVALAREQGFALNPGRVVPGSWGVAVPVLWPDGRPAAALTIAAIDSRMGPARQAELVRLLRAETALIEARLARPLTPGASPAPQPTLRTPRG